MTSASHCDVLHLKNVTVEPLLDDHVERVIKLFSSFLKRRLNKLECLSLLPSPMFVVKDRSQLYNVKFRLKVRPRAYPIEVPLKAAPLWPWP